MHCVDSILGGSLPPATREHFPDRAALVRELVMRQDAERYARTNEVLVNAALPSPIDPHTPLFLIAGADDQLSPATTTSELVPWLRDMN